jgi:hypothetical protein
MFRVFLLILIVILLYAVLTGERADAEAVRQTIDDAVRRAFDFN